MATIAERGFARLRRRALSERVALLTLAAGAGIAVRIWSYRTSVGIPDSDEAIVGLMARHALHGHLSVFYWGQPYGGTQEVLLAVPFVALGGKSYLALRLVSTILAAVAALLVWRVGRRTVGEPAAAVAGALLWLWPPYTIVHVTLHEYGFYASNLVYVSLLLLLALRIVERPDRVRVGAFGLVLGLAFWQTAQIIPIALPAIAWTCGGGARRYASSWSPPRSPCSERFPGSSGTSSITGARCCGAPTRPRTRTGCGCASPLLPMLLGLRTPLTGHAILPKALMYVVYVGLLSLFVLGAVRTRRQNVSLLYVVAAAFPLLWAISHRVTLLTSHPVYLVVLSPIVALLLAQTATTHARGIVLLALACVVSVVSLHRMDVWRRTHNHWPPTFPRDFGPLISTLDRLHLDRVFADYWIAYRLDFDTHERIIASDNPFLGVSFTSGRAIAAWNRNARNDRYQRVVRPRRATASCSSGCMRRPRRSCLCCAPRLPPARRRRLRRLRAARPRSVAATALSSHAGRSTARAACPSPTPTPREPPPGGARRRRRAVRPAAAEEHVRARHVEVRGDDDEGAPASARGERATIFASPCVL